jgi:putative spermidine/putrescine transport system permease protein
VTSAATGADRIGTATGIGPQAVVREEASGEADVPLVFRIGAALAFVVMLLPVVIVVLAGLNAGEYLTFPPQGLSLRWVIGFLTSESLRTSYLLSLLIAFVVMLLSTTLGTMAALFLTRVNFPGRSLMRAYFLAPLMLPGLVLGLALYVFYVLTNVGLARTLPGMVIGHILVTVPYVIGTVSAALYNFDLSLEDAARSLGAGPLRAFRAITLPIISPGIMAGSIFAFIVSFGQFDVSLFLSTPNITPLPIAIYNSLRYKFEPTAAAAGVFAIALVVLSMLLTSRLTNLARFAGIKFS